MAGRLRAARPRPSGAEVRSALAAILGLAVLVTGIPAALWLAVGWPLPHALPSLGTLRTGLDRATIPDEFLIKAVATMAWLVWAQFLACIAAETTAALHGRRPHQVPWAGWGVQSVAAKLVAAVLLLVPTPAMASQRSSGVPAKPPAVVRVIEPHRSGGEPTAVSSPDQATPALERMVAEQAPWRYVVRRHDTLWRIAERHLGDPLRWPEIFALNRGREQPDGRRLEQAHWIYPGWELLMPPGATALPQQAGAEPHPGHHQQPDQERGGGQPRGGQQPETEPRPHHDQRPAAPTPGNRHGRDASTTLTGPPPTTAGRQGSRPGAVWPPVPGASVPAPPASRQRPTTTEPTTTPPKTGGQGGPAVPAPSHPTTTTPRPESPDTSERSLESEPRSSLDRALPFVAGFLAAGVLSVLAVLRRVRQRRRPPGTRLPPPEPGSARSELVLRDRERPEDAALVDLALRALSGALRRDGLEAPPILALQVGGEYLEVLLGTETDMTPVPFLLGDTGHRWGLPLATPPAQLESLAEEMVAPLPALVTLGETDDGLLLVNLESTGLVALAGEEDHTRAVLAAMAVELGTSPWADYLELVLVGMGDELDGLEGVTSAATLEEALPALEHRVAATRRVLDLTGRASVLDGRVTSIAAGSWTASVLLCATPASPDAIERLTSLTADPERSTIGVVIAGEVPGAEWSLEVGADRVHVTPLGLDVRPQRLDDEEFASVVTLLRDGGDLDRDHDLDRHGDGEVPIPDALPSTRAPTVDLDRSPQVDVRVLGRIEVAGGGPIDRGKSEELIVFLALHPDGVDADRLSEALWPDRPPAPSTLNTTVTVARIALGEDEAGLPRLSHAHNGLYRLDPSVGLDWARFQALARRGFAAGEDGAEDLRDALALVRGQPFEGTKPRTYGWAELDEIRAMESSIVDAADRLAELCLRAGDHAGATWAARRGLEAAAYEERLYRRLMLAADLAGDAAGVDAVMEEMLRRLHDEDLEPYDSLHDETRELYERLRPQRQ